MDGLLKYIGNHGWFAFAFIYWGHLETARFGARAEEKNITSQLLLIQMITVNFDSVLYGFANSRIMLCTAAE